MSDPVIMVTVTVRRGGKWEPSRTLSIGSFTTEFPRHLHRAIAKVVEPEADDEPDEEPAPVAPTMTLW
jgi:hypothetical protein